MILLVEENQLFKDRDIMSNLENQWEYNVNTSFI